MKIVFVTEINPFPPLGGESIRVSNLLKALQSFASVHLVILSEQGAKKNHTRQTQDNSPVESITYIDKKKTLSSGLIERLRPSREVLDQLREIGKKLQPDIVWLEYAYIAHYSLAFPGVKVVFDTHNIQSKIDRQIAILPTSNLLKKIYSNLVWKASEYHETKYLPTCNAVITVSNEDLEYYKGFVEASKLWIIPNLIDLCIYPSQEYTKKKQTINVVFTGSMDAFQNQRAGDYLLEKIWPKIADAIPTCELFIVGKNPPKRWLETSISRVCVTGKVVSTIPYLEAATAAIVPIIDGSGTRYKIIEAMACSLPVVSTSLGCQGLDVHNGVDILIEDEVDMFVKKTIELLKSPQLQASIAAKAYKIVQHKYSIEANRTKLYNLCSMLVST